MPVTPQRGRAYHGPVVCLTLKEASRVAHALRHDHGDDEAKSVLRKIGAALNAHPAFRTPAK